MERRRTLVGAAASYLGGLLLAVSMVFGWPAPGRQGSEPGLQLIGRISRVARLAGVRWAWMIAPLWFLIPLCGALVMVFTAMGTRRALLAASAATVLAAAELVLLFHVFGVLGLDRSAGAGFSIAIAGVLACVVGLISCRRRSDRRSRQHMPSDVPRPTS